MLSFSFTSYFYCRAPDVHPLQVHGAQRPRLGGDQLEGETPLARPDAGVRDVPRRQEDGPGLGPGRPPYITSTNV